MIRSTKVINCNRTFLIDIKAETIDHFKIRYNCIFLNNKYVKSDVVIHVGQYNAN
jgi:hypothetical protein